MASVSTTPAAAPSRSATVRWTGAVLENDTTVSGGLLTLGADGFSASLEIETGAAGFGHGATLDGVTVDNAHGQIGIGEVTSGVILTLDDDTSITNGTLTINPTGELNILAGDNGGSGASLDGCHVMQQRQHRRR